MNGVVHENDYDVMTHLVRGRIAKYYEDGKHVRTTYADGHSSDNYILHFEDGKHVRTTR